MKTPVLSILVAAASVSSLPAAVTISALVHIPNGTANGGNSGQTGALTVSPSGNIAASTSGGVVTLPVTTFTVTNLDLTSVGGTANETFTYTVAYSQTGGTGIQFSGFGNVAVTGNSDNNNVNGSETLTATVTLTSTSFPQLSLVGFTQARAGGVLGTETGTFTHGGGSVGVSNGNTIQTVSGTTFTLSAGSGSAINLEGFTVQFTAVPEPASATLLGLGAFALLRRRRVA